MTDGGYGYAPEWMYDSSYTMLVRVLDDIEYRDWRFSIIAYGGSSWNSRHLCIEIPTAEPVDSPGRVAGAPVTIPHHFPIPPPSMLNSAEAAEDWVFLMIGMAELHERAEDFKVRGRRPYKPPHGLGVDAYEVKRHLPAPDVR